jgi:Yip1 domain
MEDVVVAMSRVPEELSQIERVVDTFISPDKTFTDILRSTSWWLPCVIIILCAALYGFTAVKKVGLSTMADNMIHTMPKIEETMANDPSQAAAVHARFEKQLSTGFYSAPISFVIGGFAIAGLFMATVNFVFGGRANFWQAVAVFWYSLLPLVLWYLLTIVILAAGVNTDTFQAANPVGTNIGFYMPDSSPVVVALFSVIDIFSIWIFGLQAYGMAKVARISFGKGLAAVAIWWLLFSAFKVVPALLFS